MTIDSRLERIMPYLTSRMEVCIDEIICFGALAGFRTSLPPHSISISTRFSLPFTGSAS